MANRWRNSRNSETLIFLGYKIAADGNCSHEIKRRLLLRRKAMTNLDRILKSRDIISADKCPSNRSYGFSSSHVWMWELAREEGWVLKNWCFQIVVLEKTLESPMDSKESTAVNCEYSLEGLMLKLKLQYFGYLMPGQRGKSDRLYFLGLQKSLWIVTAAMKFKDACSLKGKLWQT